MRVSRIGTCWPVARCRFTRLSMLAVLRQSQSVQGSRIDGASAFSRRPSVSGSLRIKLCVLASSIDGFLTMYQLTDLF
jgi:hypothetical protein